MVKSQVKIQQTAGRDALGEFAPEFARLNDDVLFGEVWSRNGLLSLPDSWFSHLAIEVPGEKTSNEWLEPVDGHDYSKLK